MILKKKYKLFKKIKKLIQLCLTERTGCDRIDFTDSETPSVETVVDKQNIDN